MDFLYDRICSLLFGSLGFLVGSRGLLGGFTLEVAILNNRIFEALVIVVLARVSGRIYYKSGTWTLHVRASRNWGFLSGALVFRTWI